MLTDEQKTQVRRMARGWQNAVRRGDVTVEYAATEVAGDYTRPYATVAFFEAVKAAAERYVK